MYYRTSSSVALKRFRAVLLLRNRTLAFLARALGITQPHLRLVILSERKPSLRLQRALDAALDEDEWEFVRGVSDVISDRPDRRATAAVDIAE